MIKICVQITRIRSESQPRDGATTTSESCGFDDVEVAIAEDKWKWHPSDEGHRMRARITVAERAFRTEEIVPSNPILHSVASTSPVLRDLMKLDAEMHQASPSRRQYASSTPFKIGQLVTPGSSARLHADSYLSRTTIRDQPNVQRRAKCFSSCPRQSIHSHD